MQSALYAAFGIMAAFALDAALPPAHAAAQTPAAQGTALSARLVGTWTGHRSMSISIQPQNFTVVWKTTPDGHLTGMVAVPGQRTYPVTVVWSSDTAFIAESAPHMSHELHEEVVTRSVVHFKGSSLDGSLEARPTKYTGETVTGHFTAVKSA